MFTHCCGELLKHHVMRTPPTPRGSALHRPTLPQCHPPAAPDELRPTRSRRVLQVYLTADSTNEISTLDESKVRPRETVAPMLCFLSCREVNPYTRRTQASTSAGHVTARCSRLGHVRHAPSARSKTWEVFSQIYIVGGIVDHNRYKDLTLEKAQKQGIAHARLPIGEEIKLIKSRVLTVNQMLDILINYQDTKDWTSALKKVRLVTPFSRWTHAATYAAAGPTTLPQWRDGGAS